MNEKDVQTALAPLEPLLADPAVTEILVDAPDRVYVERQGLNPEEAGIKFASPEALQAAIEAALALGGVMLHPGQTIGEARLPDGSRALAVLPPTAVDGPYLVIRKLFRSEMTRDKIVEFGVISREAYALLQNAIHARMNVLVAGGAGSGKTTFLNILTGEIPTEERVIVVEEVFELQPRHPRAVRLAADSTPGLVFADLVGAAAKMRPDRLIFGELRGPEALRILEIMNVGHDGSLMTMHATGTEDALARLEAMCLMANLGLGLGEIRYRIASTMNLIVHLQRLPSGSRKVTQIVELRGLEHDRYVLQPLFRYNPETDAHEATGAKPSWERT